MLVAVVLLLETVRPLLEKAESVVSQLEPVLP